MNLKDFLKKYLITIDYKNYRELDMIVNHMFTKIENYKTRYYNDISIDLIDNDEATYEIDNINDINNLLSILHDNKLRKIFILLHDASLYFHIIADYYNEIYKLKDFSTSITNYDVNLNNEEYINNKNVTASNKEMFELETQKNNVIKETLKVCENYYNEYIKIVEGVEIKKWVF